MNKAPADIFWDENERAGTVVKHNLHPDGKWTFMFVEQKCYACHPTLPPHVAPLTNPMHFEPLVLHPVEPPPFIKLSPYRPSWFRRLLTCFRLR